MAKTKLSKNQSLFYEAFLKASKLVINGEGIRLYNDVRIKVSFDEGLCDKEPLREDEVILDYLLSCRQRCGNGKKAMEFILSLADKYNLYVGLEAEVIEDSDIAPEKDLEDLILWYKKFNFVQEEGIRTFLWRSPEAELA